MDEHVCSYCGRKIEVSKRIPHDVIMCREDVYNKLNGLKHENKKLKEDNQILWKIKKTYLKIEQEIKELVEELS